MRGCVLDLWLLRCWLGGRFIRVDRWLDSAVRHRAHPFAWLLVIMDACLLGREGRSQIPRDE